MNLIQSVMLILQNWKENILTNDAKVIKFEILVFLCQDILGKNKDRK